MFTQYTVRDKFKNAAKIDSARVSIVKPDGTTFAFTANRNNVAIVDFINDSDPTDVHTYYMNGDNLSDASINAQARAIIASLNAQESGLGAITTGTPTTPTPEAPEIAALREATVAYGEVVNTLRVEQDKVDAAAISDILHDQYVAAYDALVAARDAVSVLFPVVTALPPTAAKP